MNNQGYDWNSFRDHALAIQQLSNNTLEDRERKLRYLQRQGITLFPLFDTTAFKKHLSARRRQHTQGGTLNHYIKAANSLLSSQNRETEKIKPFKENSKPKRIPTQKEIIRLLKTCTRSHKDKRLKTMIYFTVHTGLRVTELCNLQIKNIDNTNNNILVYRKWHKWTRLPVRKEVLTGRQVPSIQNYIDTHRELPKNKKYNDYLWIHERTRKPVTAAQFRVELKELATRAGLSWIHPHSLRHYYATWLLRLGVRLTAVQQYMGHKSLDTTQNYLHELEEDLQGIMDRLNMDDLLNRGGDQQ